MERGEYYAGQRVQVLPRPLLAEAARQPLTSALLVTDAGSFPRAAGHRIERPHGADEAILLLCAAGGGWVELDGRRQQVEPGDLLVIPPGAPHVYGADAQQPWTIWWLHVRGDQAAEAARALGGGAPHRLRAPERALVLLDELIAQLERGQTPAHLAASSALCWSLLATALSERMRPDAGAPLARAMRRLDERLAEPVTVPELAAHAGVSASHLRALFRAATGAGPLAYLQARRMARARILLDTTELTIAAIARETGHPDPLYFSRRFARDHGLSPSAYRAQRKG